MKIKTLFVIILILYINGISYSQHINGQSINPSLLETYNFKLLPGMLDGATSDVDSVQFNITLRDAVVLEAVKYKPQVPPPSTGWPVIIMVHGFGSNKNVLAPLCKEQASHGYYTLTFSMRGQGNSGGLSNLISRTEAQDLIEVVNYVKADSAYGSDLNKIIIMGGSQGGLTPFMAASMGQTSIGKLNVKTIMASLAPPDFATSWIENGSVKMTFLWSVTYPSNIARYTTLVNRMSSWVYSNNKDRWDSLAYWLPKDRDFMDIVPNNTIPMIIEGSWQDKFFNASGIVKASTRLNVPFRMYLGAVPGHGGDESPTENLWHAQFFDDWINFWIYDIQNGTLNAPKYQYASTSYPLVNNNLTFYHDSSTVWYPPGINNWRLYFNSNGLLRNVPNYYPTEREALRYQVSGGLTLREAVVLEFNGPLFESKFKRSSVNFETDVLTSDVKMLGVPKLNLQYSSTAEPFCQYNFQIFEVIPDSSKRLVTRINYTDRNYTANTVKTKSIDGCEYSHIFRAGNRIRITMTNLDQTTDESFFPLEGNPMVLPVLMNGSSYINLNENSYIELPVLGTPPIGVNNGSSNIAREYSLSQNFPNPFNPVTKIEYALPESDKVVLKVYDLLGKEVRTLVNELQRPGFHTVIFDASGLSSGIYFYKLTTDNFQDVKKMILVK
ncbi:MAG: alpha/beta fold hydrolase [Ignavibacteriae bacterium]|nr:MAG: alpha/beta fold hydrolase [Ignavibacteriota bacterium]